MSNDIKATEDEKILTKEQLGEVRITPGVAKLLKAHDLGSNLQGCLLCHRSGDWGRVGLVQNTSITQKELDGGVMATDSLDQLNLISIKKDRGRIQSIYDDLAPGMPEIWVITELYKGTVVMLPSEY